MKVLLDTTVLIDALRARNNRRSLLAQLLREGHELCTTALNIAEVYAGMRPQEATATESFLADFPAYVIDRDMGRVAGTLKAEWAQRGRTLAIVDCAIAAAALKNGCLVATDNRKHFPMQELRLYPMA